jgi:hypothetical protein
MKRNCSNLLDKDKMRQNTSQRGKAHTKNKSQGKHYQEREKERGI